jgi:hypothetical protein
LMSRLVFRRYAQFSRTICTSIPLRTSTRVSPGFAPIAHRSSSFGSTPRRFSTIPKERPDRRWRNPPNLSVDITVYHSRYASGPYRSLQTSRRGITPRSVFQDGSHGEDPDLGHIPGHAENKADRLHGFRGPRRNPAAACETETLPPEGMNRILFPPA